MPRCVLEHRQRTLCLLTLFIAAHVTREPQSASVGVRSRLSTLLGIVGLVCAYEYLLNTSVDCAPKIGEEARATYLHQFYC